MFFYKRSIFLGIAVFIIATIAGCNRSISAENIQEENALGGGEIALFTVKARVLLTSRFRDFEHFKSVVKIEYDKDYSKLDSSEYGQSMVTLSYLSNGQLISRSMKSGVSQGDLMSAKDTNNIGKLAFTLKNPYPVRLRKSLDCIYTLARRKLELGLYDIAFYDLAETSMRHIITPELAFKNKRDSSEKGYINTFNHVTAQAIITSFFSAELADFISDLHELKGMPTLTTGIFTNNQLLDSVNNPLDNYIDIINNEIGQEIGLILKAKYNINRKTICTPILIADYLNDIQRYYMWALEIGLKPYEPNDKLIVKFSAKINTVLKKL